MKYYLIFILISVLPTNVLCLNFLRELLFPRTPRLNRVRNINSARSINDEIVLDFVGLVERHGYPAEEHYLTTEDGYKLTFHRIPGSPKSPNGGQKPVVFFQHGILASSDSWVLLGPDKDLAFILADEGYDVWLGNVRGNTYCRSHEELTPNNRDFWSFSYHEIAVHDLPAMIDYALNITNEKTIYYIGHSMGTTVSYVLLSTKPEYSDKIRLDISLAPVAFWQTSPKDFLYDILHQNFNDLKKFLDSNQVFDILPQTTTNARIGKGFCSDDVITQRACIEIIFQFSGSSPVQFNTTILPYLLSYVPAGASTQTFYHYVQNMDRREFAQYDYGYIKNFKIYGMKKPPIYDVKKITTKIALMYAQNDPLVPDQNLQELKRKLQNVVYIEKIPYKTFNHLDFVWAREAKSLIYDRILSLISKY